MKTALYFLFVFQLWKRLYTLSLCSLNNYLFSLFFTVSLGLRVSTCVGMGVNVSTEARGVALLELELQLVVSRPVRVLGTELIVSA